VPPEFVSPPDLAEMPDLTERKVAR
jgi:hypothetical protein